MPATRRLVLPVLVAFGASLIVPGVFLMSFSAGSAEVHPHPDPLGWVVLAAVAVLVFVFVAGVLVAVEEHRTRNSAEEA